jgi:hypothetical protein
LIKVEMSIAFGSNWHENAQSLSSRPLDKALRYNSYAKSFNGKIDTSMRKQRPLSRIKRTPSSIGDAKNKEN